MFNLTRESLEGWSNPAHRAFPGNSLVYSLSLAPSWGGGYLFGTALHVLLLFTHMLFQHPRWQ